MSHQGGGGGGDDNDNLSVGKAATADTLAADDDLYDDYEGYDDDDDTCFWFSWCHPTRKRQPKFIAINSPQNATVDSMTTSAALEDSSSFQETPESTAMNTAGKDEVEEEVSKESAMAEDVDEADDFVEEEEVVEEIEEEDPKFIADCLKKMKLEIERILKTTKKQTTSDDSHAATSALLTPYEMALTLAPNKYYSKACQSSFHLMFLRAANYNPKVAAENCILHFDYKADLFGIDKVAKDIMIDEDFNEDDKETLYSGYIQYIPTAKHTNAITNENGDESCKKDDHSNTTKNIQDPQHDDNDQLVEVISPRHAKFKSWKNLLKAHWYLIMTTLQNNEMMQRKGVGHTILYDRESGEDDDVSFSSEEYSDFVTNWSKIMCEGALPLRRNTLHCCYSTANNNDENDPSGGGSKLGSVIRTSLTSSRNAKDGCNGTYVGSINASDVYAHFGTHQECQYSLLRCKIIPRYHFPIDFEGNLILSDKLKANMSVCNGGYYDEFLQQQLTNERRYRQGLRDKNFVDAASSKDVLMLSSPICWTKNPGNLQLLDVIEERRDEYNGTSSNLEQLCISWDVVKILQDDNGGRFLLRRRLMKGIHKGNSSDTQSTVDASVDDEKKVDTASWRIMSDDECQKLVSNQLSKNDSSTSKCEKNTFASSFSTVSSASSSKRI